MSSTCRTGSESFDGILFTGSPSNVEPHRYQGEPAAPGTLHDPARDATTLPMITRAVEAGLPVFGICRGFQEMNVAFGGSLLQKLQELPGKLDHREDGTQPLDVQYGPSHEVELTEGGIPVRPRRQRRIKVNSLHSQGVEKPRAQPRHRGEGGGRRGRGLPRRGAPTFALAVQWHPEWKVMDNPFSRALFAAFGQAGRERAARRVP